MNDEQWLSNLAAVANAEDQRLAEAEHGLAILADAPIPVPPLSTNPVAIRLGKPEPAPARNPSQKVDSMIVAGISAASDLQQGFPPQALPRRARTIVHGDMPNLGMIEQFMKDQAVGDILINGIHSIYVDRGGKMVDSGIKFSTHEQVWDLAERILRSVGQNLSHDRPMVDSRLPDGSRVNIVAPPMAVDGVSISIRKFPSKQITLESMVQAGNLTPELAKFLSECIRTRLNIIVSGGTGSGKTTLLNALSGSIGIDERVVTIEDSAELRLQQPHVVRLESKVPAVGEKAEFAVTIRDLVKNALRMRPDRIIVGESRGPEAMDVLQAMNTGHDGSMTTLHANSPRDALSRLETMVSMAMPQLPLRLVRGQIASTVNLIINVARCKDGTRRIMYVSEISGMEGEIIVMQDLVVFTEGVNGQPGHYRWANGAPRNQLVTDAARISGMMRGMR
ncbi:MAG: CpaF family protein [Rickettsiales bacterium]